MKYARAGFILFFVALTTSFVSAEHSRSQGIPDRCEKQDLCVENAFIDVNITDEAGIVSPGQSASVTAELDAYATARDDIVYGVIGTGSGEVIALNRMPSLGSGTLKVETLAGNKYAGRDLYFSAHWVVSREAARRDFDLKNAVKVGEVSDYRGPDRQYFPEEKPDLPTRDIENGNDTDRGLIGDFQRLNRNILVLELMLSPEGSMFYIYKALRGDLLSSPSAA